MVMTRFCRNSFKVVFEIALWLNFIICPIVGYVLGDAGDNGFLGLILGLVVGVVYNILVGGYIAHRWGVDSKLEKMAKKSLGIDDIDSGSIDDDDGEGSSDSDPEDVINIYDRILKKPSQ
jgi:hypothetical protein